MNRGHLYRLVLLAVLFALLLPLVVFGQEGGGPQPPDATEVQMPQPSVPLQLGSTITLEGTPAADNATAVTTDADLPAPAVPAVGDSSQQPEVPDINLSGLGDPANEPDALETCANYVQNPSFEANASWSSQGTVQYSAYPVQGARGVYMSSKDRKNALLWQKLTLPAQAQSLFVRFWVFQNIDVGERLYVQVNDASNTRVLWSRPVDVTRGSWQNPYWYLPVQQFAGQTVNIVFYLQQDGDGTPSNVWLDVVELAACNSAQPPAANTGKIDLIVSIYRSVSPAEHYKYDEIMRWAADAIYEMSNGRHYLGTVTYYQKGQNRQNAHVIWNYCKHPSAQMGGYVRRADWLNGKLYMGDVFPKADTNCAVIDIDMLAERKTAGYILGHELGHYFYGLYDEYNTPVLVNGRWEWAEINENEKPQWSVMNNQYCALAPNHCPGQNAGNYLYWLNFSHKQNFLPQHQRTSQYIYHKANAWDTLVRSPYADPRSAWLSNVPRRTLYPELAAVAPRIGVNNGWPSLELPAGHDKADDYLAYDWRPVALNQQDEVIYAASLAVEAGSPITYPQPALLVARLDRQGETIARAALQTQVTAPDGSQSTLVLRDDGVPPDYIPDDGQYAAILPYDRNGTYLIQSTFSNPSGQAAYTDVGLMDVPWTVGSTVGEAFTASAELALEVNGYTGDDHADDLAGATTLLSDNQPLSGQIDRAGDRDMFKSTLIGDGTFSLRLTGLALGIRPRIRLWQSDGTTPIGDWTIVPTQGYYYYILLTGPMGTSFYTEISHATASADQGIYELSFGEPLSGEDGTPGFKVYLPNTIR